SPRAILQTRTRWVEPGKPEARARELQIPSLALRASSRGLSSEARSASEGSSNSLACASGFLTRCLSQRPGAVVGQTAVAGAEVHRIHLGVGGGVLDLPERAVALR